MVACVVLLLCNPLSCSKKVRIAPPGNTHPIHTVGDLFHGSPKSTQLTVDIPPCLALTTTIRDALIEVFQPFDDCEAIRIPAHRPTRDKPSTNGLVAACRVAPAAGGHFIFQPTRTAFDARYRMFSRRWGEPWMKRLPTPHTPVAVPFQNERDALPSSYLPHGGGRFVFLLLHGYLLSMNTLHEHCSPKPPLPGVRCANRYTARHPAVKTK